MEIKLLNTLKSNRERRAAVREIAAHGILGFDTETTGLDPHQDKLRLVQLSTPSDKTFIFDCFQIDSATRLGLKEVLEDRRRIKIAHNGKFDAQFVRRCLGGDVELDGLYDTMLASQVISAGSPFDRHSLEEVSERYLGERIDKEMQLADWTGELTEKHLEYAARDAAVLLPLRDALNRKLKTEGLLRCAALEFDACVPLAQTELNGIYLDRDQWLKQLSYVIEERKRVAEELQVFCAPVSDQGNLFGEVERLDLNLDSHVQITRAFMRLGIPVPETTQKFHLKPMAEKYPAIAKLLEYRGLQKQLTSYGYNVVECINPVTGRIHANFHQIGAGKSGRMSCSDPNLQQMPHGAEYRSCIKAAPGRTFVIADFSQVELRLLAEFTADDKYIAAFLSGMDFHRATASMVFGCAPDEVTKEQRDFAKRLNFGVVYGIGAQRFSNMTGLTLGQAEEIIKRYFATYRKVDSWLRAQAQHALRHKFTHTASGRLCRFFFDDSDEQAASLAQRNGKNSPLQGSSADITKRALRLIHDKLRGTSAMIVNIVHDEFVIETDKSDADEIAKIVIACMESAGSEVIRRVPCLADYIISDVWVKE